MRIIAGRAKGKRLTEFSGSRVRPTGDRVREALFSILISRMGSLHGCQVLDLFSGTGALAIEALSRGAERALLIDAHPESIKIIRSNLASCRMHDEATVYQGEIPKALTIAADKAPFDIIFLDPPYAQGLELLTLHRIDELDLLSDNGMIVVESDKEVSLPESIGHIQLADQRIYGITAITLYERTPVTA